MVSCLCKHDILFIICICILYSDAADNLFIASEWEKLIKAVKLRNSAKDMSELEIVGYPLVKDSDIESGEHTHSEDTSKSTTCILCPHMPTVTGNHL